LYKEVQEYYDSGALQVPDDMTLLFSDDNFGSIRRLPTGNEVDRKGGAGVRQLYFIHIFYKTTNNATGLLSFPIRRRSSKL
jgi:hypothetical protein